MQMSIDMQELSFQTKAVLKKLGVKPLVWGYKISANNQIQDATFSGKFGWMGPRMAPWDWVPNLFPNPYRIGGLK